VQCGIGAMASMVVQHLWASDNHFPRNIELDPSLHPRPQHLTTVARTPYFLLPHQQPVLSVQSTHWLRQRNLLCFHSCHHSTPVPTLLFHSDSHPNCHTQAKTAKSEDKLFELNGTLRDLSLEAGDTPSGGTDDTPKVCAHTALIRL
jgi:hypothetical protein